MGVSNSPAELARKINGFTVDVKATTIEATRAAAAVAVKSIEASRAAAGAGSGRLRGVGKKGAAISVKTTLLRSSSNPTATVRAVGPWQLLESDTKPHPIPKLTRKGGRKGSPIFGPAFGGVNTKKFVAFGDTVRRQVFHPGTKGKHPWRKGVAAAKPLTPRVYEAELREAMRRHF